MIGNRASGPPPKAAASFFEAQRVIEAFLADRAMLRKVDDMAALLVECYRQDGKVLICGNGGSLCDAMHFAEEMTGRFRKDRRPLGALALGEAGHLTCVANDYGFEHVFSRGVEALGRRGDVLIALSTSGNSTNILHAAEAAKAKGMRTVSLLGKGGGKMRGVCDVEVVVPGETADRIQELHMLILHTVVELVEVGLDLA
jgi:D-sedoheptulose 7-phosphate isomerase